MLSNVRNLAMKCVRHFNHFLFTKLCVDLKVVPKGLALKKNPCIGNFSQGSSTKWKNTLEEGGKSLVKILCEEHWKKFKDGEKEFWNVLVSFLERDNQKDAGRTLEGIVSDINSLMSSLRKKRRNKFTKLTDTGERYVTQEDLYLREFSLLNDLIFVKAPLARQHITTRRKKKNQREASPDLARQDVTEDVTRNVERHAAPDLVTEQDSEEGETAEGSEFSEDTPTEEEAELYTEPGETPVNERLKGKFVSSNVFNLSKRVLSDAEISVLSKGLKFSPTPRELDRSQIKQDLEAFGRRLRLKWMYRQSTDTPNPDPTHFKPPSKFIPKGSDVAIEMYLSLLEEQLMSISASGSNHSNLTLSEQEALRNLQADNSIVIKPADKGSGVVVWDREDYLKEAENHLSDDSTYSVCNEDPLQELQSLISRVLKDVRSRNDIDDKTLEYLMVNDPRLGRFYLLPKIHKRLFAVPGRPVISNCGYITENISSFLDFYLQPLASRVKSYIKDTNDFLLKLKSLPSLPDNAILCTIDVVGLHPSIPHDLGLEAMRKKALDAREAKDVNTESLVQLAELVL